MVWKKDNTTTVNLLLSIRKELTGAWEPREAPIPMTMNWEGSGGEETISASPAPGGTEKKETKGNLKLGRKLEKESSLGDSLKRRINFRSALSSCRVL